jgi:hypothetical protein
MLSLCPGNFQGHDGRSRCRIPMGTPKSISLRWEILFLPCCRVGFPLPSQLVSPFGMDYGVLGLTTFRINRIGQFVAQILQLDYDLRNALWLCGSSKSTPHHGGRFVASCPAHPRTTRSYQTFQSHAGIDQSTLGRLGHSWKAITTKSHS